MASPVRNPAISSLTAQAEMASKTGFSCAKDGSPQQFHPEVSELEHRSLNNLVFIPRLLSIFNGCSFSIVAMFYLSKRRHYLHL